MSDFKINASVEIDRNKADAELLKLQERASKKKLKLDVQIGNVSKLNSELSKITNVLNNAFKMDKNSISNLKQIEQTLKEINKLGKDVQKNIFGGNSSKGVDSTAQSVDKLLSKYQQLASQKTALEKQMSKTTDVQSFQVLESQLTRVNNKLTNLGADLNSFKKNDSVERSLAQTFQTIQDKITKTKLELEKFNNTKILDDKQISEVTKMTVELDKLSKVKLKDMNFLDMQKLSTDLSNVQNQMSKLKLPEADSKFSGQFDTMQKQVEGLIGKLNTLGKSGYVDNAQIQRMLSDLQKIKNIDLKSVDKLSLESSISQVNKLEQEFKDVSNAAKELKFKEKLAIDTSRVQSDLTKLRQKCVEAGRSTSDIDRLEKELKELSSVPMDKVPNNLAKIRNEVSQMKGSFSGLNTTVNTTNTFFSDLYRSFSTFTLGNMIGQQLQRGIREIGQTIIELDSSFRDMMKVAPDNFKGTADDLDYVKDKAIEAGISVARSSNDIIQGTAKSFQMGIKSIDDAMQYATQAAQFANVADLSMEDSDTYLASIMSAYGGVTNALKPLREQIQGAGEDYNNLTKFTDLANYAGNNFSVTSGDVGAILQKSASALNAFGTSMEDSIALAIGMQEITQNAEKTGTSLKSIATNLTGVKAAAKDGTLEANRTNLAFKELANIDIWDQQKNDIKGTMEVLSELSTKWEDLSQDAQVGIAEASAGKLHINSFVALMNNWKQVIKYQEDYKQGLTVGSAEKENARYIDSIEGRLVKLNEEFKKLITTTISTDMFKDMVSGATNFLSVLNNIVSGFDKIGMTTPLVIGTLGTLFTTIKAFGTKNGLSNGLIPITGISKVTAALKAQETQLVRSNGVTVSYTKGLSNLGKNVKVASSSVASASGSYKKYSVSTNQANTSMTTLSSSIGKANKGVLSTATSMAGATAKSMLLNTGITLLNGAMIGLAVAGITMAIKAFDNYINKAEKAAEKHKENIEAIQGDISTYNSQKVAINEVAKEYDELSSKADKTTNDFRRLSELKGIIAESIPDLVIGYDSNNDPILKMNGSASDLIASLDEAIKKKQLLLADEQIANGNNALDLLQKNKKGMGAAHLYDDILFNTTEGAINTAKQKVLAGLESLNTESEEKYQKNLVNYKKYMQNYKDAVIEENDKVKNASIEIEENLATVRQGVIANLNKDNIFSGLSDNVKQFAYEMTSSLDFSALSKSDLSSYTSSLKRALSDGDIDSSLKKYQELREELEKTGQYDVYEKAVASLVPELSKTLGLSEEMTKNLVNVSPSMKVATDAVDAYLQTFGKRSQMASFDEDTRNLIATYDAFNDLFLDLSNESAYIEIDGVIQYDPQIVSSILENPGLPEEIKQAIELMKEDGLTQDEVELLLKISFGYQLGDTEEGNNLLESAQNELDERLGSKSVDIGDIEVKANYKVESNNKEQLEAEIREFTQFDNSRDEVKKTLILETVGVDDIQLYADIIKNLPTNTDYTNKFIIEQIGDLKEFENYQEVIEWVKANPEIAQAYKINVDNLDKFTESAKRLNELEEKKVTTYVDVEGDEEVVSATDEIIENQNEIENKEVSLKVNKGEIQGTAEDIKTLIEYSTKLEDGTYNISFKTDTAEAIEEIEKFKLAINNLANQFMGIPDVTTEIDTEQSAKNISGLIKRIKEYLDASGNIKPITFIANTEQAAKNISGLIRRINEVPTGTKTLTYNVNTNYKDSGTPSPVAGIQTYSAHNVVQSVIRDPNEISLLSESSVAETVAMTNVQELNSRARAKNPIGTMDSLQYNVNALKNLEIQLKKIANELDFINEKAENAFGRDKIKHLERQIVLYKQQQSIQHQLAEGMRVQQSDLKGYLSGQGFKFDGIGNVVNYAEKLLAIEKELEKLNNSDNRDKYSSKIDQLNQTKDALQTYLDLTFDKIPSASEEWWKLQNSINSVNDSIENVSIDRVDKFIEVASEEELVGLLEEKKKLLQNLADKKREYIEVLKKQGATESQIEEATYEWKKQEQAIKDVEKELEDLAKEAEKLASDIAKAVKKATEDIMGITQDIIKTQQNIIKSQVDLLDKQMQLSNFDVTGTYEALEKKVALLEREMELQKQLNNEIVKQKDYYKSNLISMGIEFDSNGIAKNAEQILNKIKNQMANATNQDDLSKLEEQFNDIVSTLKDYNSSLEDISSNQNAITDIQLGIQDVYEEMLNTTKKMEDKISDILRKQVEERKKLIDDELKKRLDSLKKEKDAYNESREKEDWDKENNKRLKELEELQAKIESASRDTSLAGQAKLEELLKEMAEKQESYNDFIQDKLDKDINDRYDAESDRLEEEAEKAKEELDKKLEKEELAQVIKDALSTGKLTNIDGSITDLKDALLEYEDKYGDGLSVIGGLIKKDLLGQLDISLDTMQNIEKILKTLNIGDLSKSFSMVQPNTVIDMNRFVPVNPVSVHFNDSLITVQGNVTPDVIPELKRMVKNVEDNITRNIIKKM